MGRFSSHGLHKAARAVGLLLAAAGSQACVSGHLIDHARRDERVQRIEAVASDGRQLYVQYVASVTNEWGDRLGSRSRAARVPIEALDPSSPLATDEIPVHRVAGKPPAGDEWQSMRLRPRSGIAAGTDSDPGRPSDLLHANGHGNGNHNGHGNGTGKRNGHVSSGPSSVSYTPTAGDAPVAWLLESPDGRTWDIELAAGPWAPGGARLPSGALARTGTAAWLWPLVPFAVAFDVLATPVLVFFAVPMVVVGD